MVITKGEIVIVMNHIFITNNQRIYIYHLPLSLNVEILQDKQIMVIGRTMHIQNKKTPIIANRMY